MKSNATYDNLGPKLEARWQGTPTSERYVIAGERYVLVARDGRHYPVPLSEVAADKVQS